MATKFWVRSNEDAKAAAFRKKHEETHTGAWVKDRRKGWLWEDRCGTPETPKKVKKETPVSDKAEVKKKKRKLF